MNHLDQCKVNNVEHTNFIVDPKNSNLNGIDLFKFICSIAVFIVHVPFSQDTDTFVTTLLTTYIKNCLCRIAVPYFFISSSFLLYRKMDLDSINTKTIKNYCYNLCRLLGIWSILLFIGGTFHLWFLGATVIGIIIVSIFLYFKVKLRYLFILSSLLYVIGLLGDTYYVIIERHTVITKVFSGYFYFFDQTRNGLFMGTLFILIGAVISRSNKKIGTKKAVLGFFLSLVLLILEVYILNRYYISANHNMYIFLPIAAYFLFQVAYNLNIDDSLRYIKLRRLSVIIYFTHLVIDTFIVILIKIIIRFTSLNLMGFRFIISLSTTVIISLLIDYLISKKNITWINFVF